MQLEEILSLETFPECAAQRKEVAFSKRVFPQLFHVDGACVMGSSDGACYGGSW